MAKAFSLAPANLLTPFTYLQILSALVFGFLVFGDIPDVWTFVGIALIVGAGLYVFGRSAPSGIRFDIHVPGKNMNKYPLTIYSYDGSYVPVLFFMADRKCMDWKMDCGRGHQTQQ